MKARIISSCAIILLLAFCIGSLFGCMTPGEPVQTPAPHTSAPETPIPETPLPETPEPEPEIVRAVYEKKCDPPLLDATSVYLELLETDGILHFRTILEYPYGRSLFPVYSGPLEKTGDGFHAVCDDEYEHIEITGDRDGVMLDYNINGEHDEGFSGQYLPAEEPMSRFPDIPETETDPLSPGGEIELHISEAAKKELGIAAGEPLTEEDCAKVKSLILDNAGVTCLNGIEYFTNLEVIHIRIGYIADLTPLLAVPSLVDIGIEFCPVKVLPDFSSLENLKYLSVMGCLITDVSPAAKLHGMELIDLSYNRISSVAPLAPLDPPGRLVLNHNSILDWESIAENDALTESLDWDIADALAVQERATELLNETIKPGMTDIQKQVAICKKIHEIADSYEGSRPMEPDGYEILINGRGVCSDYSQAVALLLNMEGIDAITCISGPHAWNMAKLDGEWYEFDCYWDDDKVIEDWIYFDLSYEEMSKVGEHKLINPWVYPLAEHSLMTLSIMYDYDTVSD